MALTYAVLAGCSRSKLTFLKKRRAHAWPLAVGKSRCVGRVPKLPLRFQSCNERRKCDFWASDNAMVAALRGWGALKLRYGTMLPAQANGAHEVPLISRDTRSTHSGGVDCAATLGQRKERTGAPAAHDCTCCGTSQRALQSAFTMPITCTSSGTVRAGHSTRRSTREQLRFRGLSTDRRDASGHTAHR
jgi:hypothetical protein